MTGKPSILDAITLVSKGSVVIADYERLIASIGVLINMSGLTYQELSLETGIPVSTLRSRLRDPDKWRHSEVAQVVMVLSRHLGVKGV